MDRRLPHGLLVVAVTLTVAVELGAAHLRSQALPSGTITGTVTEAITGRPLAGALVTAGGGGFAALTDADGVYTATVPAGTYSLTVSVQSHPFQTVFGAVVSSGGTTTVNFAVPLPLGTGVIMGHVRKTITNEPLASALVTTTPGAKSAVTDGAGLYVLNVPSGTYTITASLSGYQTAPSVGIAVVPQAVATRDVVLTPQPTPNGTLTGHVRDSASGFVISNATVTVTPGEKSMTTDGNGAYALSLAPGTYSISVAATGYDGASSAGAIVAASAITTRDIAMTKTRPNGTLTGHVRDAASGFALSNAIVTVTPGGKSTMTDESGVYALSLSPGTYTIAVAAAGFDDASIAGAVVSSSTTTTRDIAMTKLPVAVLERLHSFKSGEGGAFPRGPLVAGTDGNFYGTTSAGGPRGLGTVFSMTPSGAVTTLHTFTGADGSDPAPLIQGRDGAFYGTTFYGGDEGVGTVFKITAAGTMTTLHSFVNGDHPRAALVQAADGNFYGTTSTGGESRAGTAFRMTPAGTITVLHMFSEHVDGFRPSAALIQATDGNLYGTTAQGSAGFGAVFRMTPAGAVTVLHAFTGATDGFYPVAALAEANDGSFFGTTLSGGSNNLGTIFKVSPTGGFAVLHTFARSDGAYSQWGLTQAPDGNLYGTAGSGGSSDRGVAFRITTAGTFAVLHSFTPESEAFYPSASLLQLPDGSFYGVSGSGVSNAGTIFRMTPAGNVTVVHAFVGDGDGVIPFAPLRQAPNGSFYGTANGGGAAVRGTVFKMTSEGIVTVLHAFIGGADGALPAAPLLLAADGSFYGTTGSGGTDEDGTIFKMDPGGVVSILHSFKRTTDGAGPAAGLLQASDGNFYGTTGYGGASDQGTIFRMTPAGTVTVLYEFTGNGDGAYPSDEALIQATDGNIYGTTFYGGANDVGTIFRMTPGGAVTILHSFTFDDAWPNGIMQATDGNFYGTTLDDIFDFDGGSIFKMTPDGTVAIIHSFTFFDANGVGPGAGLIEGSDGNFYGTTLYGSFGAEGGTIFRMTPGGTVTTLHTQSPDEGTYLYAPLLEGADGFLYGTAGFGGEFRQGTLFRVRLSPPLSASNRIAASQLNQAQSASTLDAAAPIFVNAPPVSISVTKATSPASQPTTPTMTPRTFAFPAVVFQPSAPAGSPAVPSTVAAPPVVNGAFASQPVGGSSLTPAGLSPDLTSQPVPTRASPAGSRSRTWAIEAMFGAMLPGDLAHGAGTSLAAGSSFVTTTGQAGKRVSSWYFGDGAQLLTQVNRTLGASASVTPLDPVLTTPVASLDRGTGVGVRISRTMTSRLTAEFTVESAGLRVNMTNAGIAGIEASRASFAAAWMSLAAAGQFDAPSVTSVSTFHASDGREFTTTGAINVSLKRIGRFTPRLTGGAGFSSSSDATLTATIAGSYQFVAGAVTPVREADSVSVKYSVAGHGLVGLAGAGFTYDISRRVGVRMDGRVYVGANRLSTRLRAHPVVSTMSPAGSVASLTSPGIQFSNDPSIGIRSSLSGPEIVDFQTFAGTGIVRQVRITTGFFWRF